MRCRHCHLLEDEHHAFAALVVPDGCVCDAGTWDDGMDALPPICVHFVTGGNGLRGDCDQCEHERACHRAATP